MLQHPNNEFLLFVHPFVCLLVRLIARSFACLFFWACLVVCCLRVFVCFLGCCMSGSFARRKHVALHDVCAELRLNLSVPQHWLLLCSLLAPLLAIPKTARTMSISCAKWIGFLVLAQNNPRASGRGWSGHKGSRRLALFQSVSLPATNLRVSGKAPNLGALGAAAFPKRSFRAFDMF